MLTIQQSTADDGNSPTLASIGPCSIDIYTGSRDQQTGLQNLAASVDVSKASSVTATINPTIGSNGMSTLSLNHSSTNPSSVE